MDLYPLIKRCFPGVLVASNGCLLAVSLEKELEKAMQITGFQETGDKSWWFGSKSTKYDTHSALVIGLDPIGKSIKKSELKNLIDVADSMKPSQIKDLLSRILEHGVEG